MRYLDPKADLTFKRVFGEHADLLKSLLNSLLPLDTEEQMIDTLEYLPSEQVPDNPMKKNSIVDVKCKDKTGRFFIVEIHIIWSMKFLLRVLFNAPKAYVRQLNRSEDFKLLQPVYALALVNDIFEPDDNLCIHNYPLMEMEDTGKVIDNLHLTLIELPKFQPYTVLDNKKAELWIRYLMGINEKTHTVPKELLEDEEIRKAMELVNQSSYTDIQMEWYDEFWDAVRVEKTLVNAAKRKGFEIGIEQAKGFQQGRQQGIEQGRQQTLLDVARNLKSQGLPIEAIANATGLPADDIAAL